MIICRCFRCGASADAAAEFARTGFFRWHIGIGDVLQFTGTWEL